MKFGNHVLRKAVNVEPGDRISFDLASANYTVESVEVTQIGMVKHTHSNGTARSSYWPNEILYVEAPNA